MFLLFSGEGITDLSAGNGNALVCEGEAFVPGPMAIFADQVVEARFDYSALESGGCGYVSEHRLTERAGELKAARKSLALPGKKRAKETRYFINNARALAMIANELEKEKQDEVVAVLFRDADGTASAGRGLWSDKHTSMLHGFDEEEFARGVPMIPKPKSEAWILCALKNDPYTGCNALEKRSGNDASPHSLKKELAKIIGEVDDLRETLCDLVADRTIDIDQIDMPSFHAFRKRL